MTYCVSSNTLDSQNNCTIYIYIDSFLQYTLHTKNILSERGYFYAIRILYMSPLSIREHTSKSNRTTYDQEER